MSPLALLRPIVLLCTVGAIQAAPAAGKVGEDALKTVISVFPWDPSSPFSVRLPIPILALGTAVEPSPFSTVLTITLPPPTPETTNTNGTWIPSTSTVVVNKTAVVTSTRTTTAEASTVTVPLFFPPETVTNTVIITFSPSPLISTTTATEVSTTTVALRSSSPSSRPSPITTRSSSSRAAPKPSSGPSASGRLPSLDGLAVWTAPNQLKNLDSFNITSTGGQKNLKIVNGMPSLASTSSNQRVSAAKVAIDSDTDDDDDDNVRQHSLPPVTSWAPSSSSLQLFYPAGSINPAQKPQGGAEFYASPLDISTARNVSFRFSVFFPADFDWVLAGKLPGIYGGHTGCSGGNKALDCFSTRLMWRKGGLGELYLYAAKDKQTKALCADPRSVCDAAYGFSIGRGSFTWAAGAWTTVVQTVVLNTPGKQDGFFKLEVNGKSVIDRSDVFYRDLLWPSSGKASSTVKSTKRPITTTAPPPSATTTVDDPLGDILGPLLSEITHLILRRGGTKTQIASELSQPTSMTLTPLSEENALPTSNPTLAPMLWGAAPTATSSSPTVGHATSHVGRFTGAEAPQPTPRHSALVGISASPSPIPTPTPGSVGGIVGRSETADDDVENSVGEGESEEQPGQDGGEGDGTFSVQATPQREGDSIGFIGLFFSTFFGGHDEKYATPRDQYVWFKDFAISYND